MRKVEKNMIYKHFKGNYYYVVDIAYDANNDSDSSNKKVVVYKSLSNNVLYVRDLEEFSSEVDHRKYPDVKQRYRFERVNLNKLLKYIFDSEENWDKYIKGNLTSPGREISIPLTKHETIDNGDKINGKY